MNLRELTNTKNLIKTASLSGLFLALSLAILPTADAHNFGLGFTAQPGSQAGTVLLQWQDVDVVTNYNLAYGTTPGSQMYGAVNIGDTSQYLVQSLTPGQKYYFTLSPVVNGTGLDFGPAVSAVAAGKGVNQNKVSQATFYAPYGGPTNDWSQLKATAGPGAGQVTLLWSNPINAHDFDVVYGTSTVYQHGAQNVGQGSNTVVISGLTSGTSYFFSILGQATDGSPVGSFSAPVAQVAK